MIFFKEKGGELKLNDEAVQKMLLFVQDEKSKPEGGGVLLGRFLKNSENIIIDRVSVPMIGDVRKRNYFKRAQKRHQKIIDTAWEKSNGTCNYLGEWHTHPENYPTPSWLDKKEWKRKLREDTFDSKNLLFVIVGIKETRIWEGDKVTLKIKRLKRKK